MKRFLIKLSICCVLLLALAVPASAEVLGIIPVPNTPDGAAACFGAGGGFVSQTGNSTADCVFNG